MSDICKVKVRWTREVLITAMQHHQRLKIRRGFLVTIKIFSIVLLAFLVLLLIAWIILPSTSPPPILPMTILLAFSLYWLIFDRLNAWYWSLGFSKRPDANIEIDWQFSDNEIRIQSDLGTANVSWKSFVKIVETRDGFLFYPQKKLFHWLPFAAFESPECIAKVRRLIREKGY
jgi:hypothetical protein